MAPMPPPPQKGGSNVALIVLVVIVAVVVLGGGGCVTCLCLSARAAKKAADTGSGDTTTTAKALAPTPQPTANNNWITAEHPHVKFLAPAGWSTEITPDKEWGIFRSPARDAVLTFTTFSRPGESTVRLGKAANVLGVTDISWNAPRYGTVGKEGFPDHYANGSCNFKGPNGFVSYATVNPGNDDHQILLIFAVAASAPQARRNEAQGAIDSLQHR